MRCNVLLPSEGVSNNSNSLKILNGFPRLCLPCCIITWFVYKSRAFNSSSAHILCLTRAFSVHNAWAASAHVHHQGVPTESTSSVATWSSSWRYTSFKKLRKNSRLILCVYPVHKNKTRINILKLLQTAQTNPKESNVARQHLPNLWLLLVKGIFIVVPKDLFSH